MDVTPPQGTQKTIRRWENGLERIDLEKQSRELNAPMLKNYNRDPLHYKPEVGNASADYWHKNEAKIAHGYPATSWLQIGLLYGTGLYTAKQQGLVAKGVIFTRFWGYHYFDWITYIKRAGLYAGAGGLVLGTVLFGSPELSVRRAVSFYHSWFSMSNVSNRRGGEESSVMTGKF